MVAHLVGVAADSTAGRVAGAPGPEWTAPQVSSRRGRGLEEVLAEWDEVGPRLEAALADRQLSSPLAHDLLTHEADLQRHWAAAVRWLVRQLLKNPPQPGTLVLHVGAES